MISPVLYDRPFKLEAEHSSQVNSFVNLGSQRGNRGLIHVLFLKRALPENAEVSVSSDGVALTGYCNYRYVSVNGRMYGVLLGAFAPRCKCTQMQLSVANHSNLPNKFEPVYSLENMGLLAFRSDDSSLLVLPKVPHENAFLVKDIPNGT